VSARVPLPLPPRSAGPAYPFRLATTSYILPAGYAENAAFLAPAVDELELLFFESLPEALPGADEIGELSRIRRGKGIGYHVHLPLDLRLGHPDGDRRRRDRDTIRRLIADTAPLAPTLFVVHLAWDGPPAPGAADVAAWRRRTGRSLASLARAGVPMASLCAETLKEPPAWMLPLVGAFGMGLCLDAGHLLLQGEDPVTFLERHGGSVRTVHLYGPEDDGRHGPLTRYPEGPLDAMLSALRRFDGVLSLEVFSLDHLSRSLALLQRRWRP
jgi:sugar phosphate isomerase/epimerase